MKLAIPFLPLPSYGRYQNLKSPQRWYAGNEQSLPIYIEEICGSSGKSVPDEVKWIHPASAYTIGNIVPHFPYSLVRLSFSNADQITRTELFNRLYEKPIGCPFRASLTLPLFQREREF